MRVTTMLMMIDTTMPKGEKKKINIYGSYALERMVWK